MEVWLKEPCDITPPGGRCLYGESHARGTHGRKVDEATLDDALTAVVEADGRDLRGVFLDWLRRHPR